MSGFFKPESILFIIWNHVTSRLRHFFETDQKLTSGMGCRTGPPGYIGWWAGTTTPCLSQLYIRQSGLLIWLQGIREIGVVVVLD